DHQHRAQRGGPVGRVGPPAGDGAFRPVDDGVAAHRVGSIAGEPDSSRRYTLRPVTPRGVPCLPRASAPGRPADLPAAPCPQPRGGGRAGRCGPPPGEGPSRPGGAGVAAHRVGSSAGEPDSSRRYTLRPVTPRGVPCPPRASAPGRPADLPAAPCPQPGWARGPARRPRPDMTADPMKSAERAPRVGLVSLGCPKALVDSERILTQLRVEGYELVPTYEDADVVVVNTCGFIDSAVAESLDAIG